MSQRPHERAAELQHQPEHAHTVAAASHTKNDRATAHEQSVEELAHAEKALKKSIASQKEEIVPPPAKPGVTG
jgi:hypothetical protein